LNGTGSTLHHLAVTAGSLTLATGTVNLTSPDSAFSSTRSLAVGGAGQAASLVIQNGAVLSTPALLTGEARIDGASATSPSTITVTGAGSTWRPGYTAQFGGNSGPGRLVVEAG